MMAHFLYSNFYHRFQQSPQTLVAVQTKTCVDLGTIASDGTEGAKALLADFTFSPTLGTTRSVTTRTVCRRVSVTG